jgi:hypothetical protein
MRRFFSLFLVALAAALVVPPAAASAAGGDALPKGFRSDANAICRKSQRRIVDAQLTLFPDKATDPAAASAVYLDDVQPIYRKLVRDLRALGYPSGHKQQLRSIYAAMTRAMDRAVAEIEGEPSVAVIGPGTFGAVNDRLDAIGLTRCGSG